MSAPAQILLVRHGQSTWNAENRWQGTEDPPLSTLGVRQARAAAEVLGVFDAVVASPLERAHTTATILAESIGIGPVVVEHGLRERHAGGFQGLTRDEIEERYPGWLEARREPPGWEPDEEVVERAVTALAQVAIAVGPGGTALVVSHGGVIRCLEDLHGIPRRRLPNLAGRWFRMGARTFDAGDEALLVDHDQVTVPGQI